jgi:RNA polymerase sigma factor (sigma-70 family)
MGMEAATYAISNESLLDFLHVAEPQAQYFPTTARPLMKTFARRAAPELPADVQDEVVSQSFEYLIQSKAQFQPERGSAKAFLKVLTRQAVRKIRADYCPPGRRTRPDRHDRRQQKPKIVSLSDINENVLVNRDAVDELDTNCEVKAILRRAPEKVARALVLIYFAGERVSSAARAVGMSRFALSREIARFMRAVRERGAA